MLDCKPGQELGGVRVNGKLNFCADLVKVVVSPLQTSVGNQIDVFAMALHMEGDSIEYRWTGTGGSFADASAQQTTFTCLELGDHTITVTVSDDGLDYCDCTHTVDVTCVEGDGGGGAGGSAGSGGMPENQCPFYTSILVSPLTQSVGNLINVDTRVLDLDGGTVEVLVTSNCGEVADPFDYRFDDTPGRLRDAV